MAYEISKQYKTREFFPSNRKNCKERRPHETDEKQAYDHAPSAANGHGIQQTEQHRSNNREEQAVAKTTARQDE